MSLFFSFIQYKMVENHKGSVFQSALKANNPPSGIFLIFFLTMIVSCQSKWEKRSLAHGEEVYIANCISCHLESGEGVPGVYPTLRKSGRIIEVQTDRAIRLIKYGSGFENGMMPVSLTNKEIAEVVNYIQNSWGNKASLVVQSQVEAIKNQ